ncbi:Hydroxyacylglutathione hydrolase [Baekduia alba]|uniref:MBL fold metallo-hydrolase n=1 Tax=Baekduia alba TaxID=2997333 RepID=UPI00234242AA|nr:MBL fold metallo-hydrolase [Baekduia alba]WCB92895.1 Hydroxyacylglutathione hydrolase [Baekduia alba]
MLFRQITHDDLGCASYLVGDTKAGVACVVDPKLAIEEYLAVSRYMGVRIEHILETHNHADHVSGHGRLAAATGATIHVHRLAAPEYDHEPFDDGWELALGSVVVRALHTPGHRPEHTAFALTDTARGPEPWAVLTGDSLFVGDVARPDLAVDKEEGARDMHRSLRELLALPAMCEVWPGHLGGSLCGGPAMDMKISSTIAFELAHNALVAEDDPEAFVAQAISALAPQPPNFQAIVALNRGPLHTGRPPLEPLTPRQVAAEQAAGALVIDVRTDLQFDDAHIPGAICNPAVRAGFGTKLAWVADRDRDVILVGRDDEDAKAAAALSAAVGIARIGGYLAGGMTSWREDQRPTASVRRVDVATLHAQGGGAQILDVRERREWDAGHIAGAVHMPYHDIAGVPDGLDPNQPIAAICASGQRSAVAASLLLRAGATQVLHVAGGGVGTWPEPLTATPAPEHVPGPA